MKRQFMPLNTSRDQESSPEQASTSNVDKWLTADARINNSSAPSGEGLPPHVTPSPVGTGLLSGWKAKRPSAPQHTSTRNIGNPAPISMSEQDTIEQPIMPGPTNQQGLAQRFSTGQLSSRQAGMSPLPDLFANPNVQTLQPFSPAPERTSSQSLQPFVPASMPAQPQAPWTGWPATNPGFQSGPPPFAQGAPNQLNKLRKKKHRFPIWARVAMAMLILLLILTGSAVAYYEVNFAAPVNNIVNQQAPLLHGENNPNQSRGANDILSGGRINILLLGSDTDEKFQGGYLAQTDIIVTIDPSTKYVGMLSIPRDLYVNVPNYGLMKLDEAYFTGDRYEHNAVGLSRLTIYQNFGIPINYYAWVGLNGFIKVVNTAGGVDVDVLHPISDDVYPDDTGNSLNAYAYKRLYLAPGPQHLDGPTALEYVRSRHADLVGDFGRSARQQQILSQLKTKLINSNIIDKLPELAQDMNGYLKTDMQILDVVKLMNFARIIDPAKIQRVILSPPTYSAPAVASSGQDKGADIFLPICAPIQKVIASMFALGNKARCPDGQANSNTSPLATASQTPSPSASYSPTLQVPTAANASLQTFGQTASMSLNDGSNHGMFGIRSLLDLLLMIVFESPAALQL